MPNVFVRSGIFYHDDHVIRHRPTTGQVRGKRGSLGLQARAITITAAIDKRIVATRRPGPTGNDDDIVMTVRFVGFFSTPARRPIRNVRPCPGFVPDGRNACARTRHGNGTNEKRDDTRNPRKPSSSCVCRSQSVSTTFFSFVSIIYGPDGYRERNLEFCFSFHF